jgi:hypothetical protein
VPYPNEHAARQQSPGRYTRFRRVDSKFGSGVDVIFGITPDGKSEVQSIRFDAKQFSATEAKSWLKKHGYKASLEKATGQKEAEMVVVNADGTSIVEEITKKVGPRNHQSGDFLVVEDPEKTTTWHLPVKINGRPNRRMAGQAWAFLFSAEGFRGQKYDGPNKDEAKSKLKALYKDQGWDEPTEEALKEFELLDLDAIFADTTFADIVAKEVAERKRCILMKRVDQLYELTRNVINSPMIDDKLGAVQDLFDEFVDLASAELEAESPEDDEETPPEEEQPVMPPMPVEEAQPSESTPEQPTSEEESLQESDGGALATIDAPLAEQGDPNRGPLVLEAVLIRPGWGNKVDGHYYPREVLERDSSVFEGVKMYATDHRPEEKSVRTEVGIIDKIVRYDEGAPVARVSIFDPDFAESTRNRARLGQLQSLACSILAKGKVEKGTVEGKDANIVQSISSAMSVDWVTKAGAGGQAISLAEADEKHLSETGEQVSPTPPGQPAPTAPVTLTEQEILEVLAEAGIPDALAGPFCRAPYQSVDELRALAAPIGQWVQRATKAGMPFGLGQSTAETSANSPTWEEVEKERKDKFNKIMREIGGREV